MEHLQDLPSNRTCADCGVKGRKPLDWVSINLGIFVCIECAGLHRNLGVEYSKVRSIQLDTACWDEKLIKFFTDNGNKKSKELYEANAPSYFLSPDPTQHYNPMIVDNWMRAKYIRQEFKRPPPPPPSTGTPSSPSPLPASASFIVPPPPSSMSSSSPPPPPPCHTDITSIIIPPPPPSVVKTRCKADSGLFQFGGAASASAAPSASTSSIPTPVSPSTAVTVASSPSPASPSASSVARVPAPPPPPPQVSTRDTRNDQCTSSAFHATGVSVSDAHKERDTDTEHSVFKLMPEVPKCGVMNKCNSKGKWQQRWFILFHDYLYYFKSPSESYCRGEIYLKGCSIRTLDVYGGEHPIPPTSSSSSSSSLSASSGEGYVEAGVSFVLMNGDSSGDHCKSEYLLHCATKSEFFSWAHAIRRAHIYYSADLSTMVTVAKTNGDNNKNGDINEGDNKNTTSVATIDDDRPSTEKNSGSKCVASNRQDSKEIKSSTVDDSGRQKSNNENTGSTDNDNHKRSTDNGNDNDNDDDNDAENDNINHTDNIDESDSDSIGNENENDKHEKESNDSSIGSTADAGAEKVNSEEIKATANDSISARMQTMDLNTNLVDNDNDDDNDHDNDSDTKGDDNADGDGKRKSTTSADNNGDWSAVLFKDMGIPLAEGILRKQGGRWKSWNKRYCILTTTHLFYFKSRPTADDDTPEGGIELARAGIIASRCKTASAATSSSSSSSVPPSSSSSTHATHTPSNSPSPPSSALSTIVKGKPYLIPLVTPSRVYFIDAQNEQDYITWKQAVEATVDRLADRKPFAFE